MMRATRHYAIAVAILVLPDLAVRVYAEKPAADGAKPNTIRVAGIVLKWLRTDKAANFRRAEPMVREAAAGGAKIVCTTECFLDGYAIADKSIPLQVYRALGEVIPGGEYFEKLRALADELDIFLIAGMMEADGKARYNTAVLLGPGGKLLGKYRKQKLGHERVRNTPGNVSSVFETDYGKVGVMICADRTEKDIVRRFCTAGAEFLATAPDGSIASRTILGDRLLISQEQIGGKEDSQQVFYFDLPLDHSHSKRR